MKGQEGRALRPFSGSEGRAQPLKHPTVPGSESVLCKHGWNGSSDAPLCQALSYNTSFTSQCVFDHFPCRWGPSPSAMRCLPASVTQPGRGESEAALPALSDSKLLALSCSASSPPEGSSAQKHARLALLSLGASVGPNPSATHAALLLGRKDPLLSPLPGPGR